MVVLLDNWQVYVVMSISGLFTGLGSAIGAYIANRMFIKHMDKLERRLEKHTPISYGTSTT